MSRIVQSEVEPSTRRDKKFMRVVRLMDGDKVLRKKTVHFGDPKMSIKKDNPFAKKSYCARSGGIKGKNDPFSANYQSRQMWGCDDED
jgi:hypothetical protein